MDRTHPSPALAAAVDHGGDRENSSAPLSLARALRHWLIALARPDALAALMLAALLVLSALRPVADFDVWHHLRTGEQVARERRPYVPSPRLHVRRILRSMTFDDA